MTKSDCATRAAEKIFAVIFPGRYDETGRVTARIAEVIRAELADEAGKAGRELPEEKR